MSSSGIKLFSFEECLNISGSDKKHLMLGNGFSVSLFPEIFNYKVLAERIKSEKIKDLFDNLQTNDFEYVLRKLTQTILVLECYEDIEGIKAEIKEDIETLKETLIDVISNSHPKNPSEIDEEQYVSCFKFLKYFEEGKKYTFNYDLILYWVYMHFLGSYKDAKTLDEKRQIKMNSLECDDGFRHPEDDQSIVTWEIGREHQQDLYYIHGAMHIFSDGSEVEKYTWINSGKTLRQQIQESLNQSKYPVFITEGSKEQKQSRINNNAYLGRCFSSLKGITGNLFIFGHSLRDEDDHVFDFINSNSKVKNVFISIYGDVNSADNQKIISKIERWSQNQKDKRIKKNYYLYDASTANVWVNN